MIFVDCSILCKAKYIINPAKGHIAWEILSPLLYCKTALFKYVLSPFVAVHGRPAWLLMHSGITITALTSVDRRIYILSKVILFHGKKLTSKSQLIEFIFNMSKHLETNQHQTCHPTLSSCSL